MKIRTVDLDGLVVTLKAVSAMKQKLTEEVSGDITILHDNEYGWSLTITYPVEGDAGYSEFRFICEDEDELYNEIQALLIGVRMAKGKEV